MMKDEHLELYARAYSHTEKGKYCPRNSTILTDNQKLLVRLSKAWKSAR